jgi:hypothetical protein
MVSDEMKNGTGCLWFLPGIVMTLIPWIGFPAFAINGGYGVILIRMKLPMTCGRTPSLERIMVD